ncbi:MULTISPECIES: hypothetical protein [unclassified Nonomuraea]|uniref:hypothetical protein n=1 Tax=Nonomuraea sp. NPDC003804 TaxID=3154547 RepID=UPI0033B713DB
MKKIAAGLIAAAMGGALLVTGGTAAQARTTLDVQIHDIQPDPVVVAKGGETTATFFVEATKDAKVELRVEPVSDIRTFAAKNVSVIPNGDNWKFTVPFSSGDEGKWRAIATATKGGETDRDKATFDVEVKGGKADTRITSFRANPDPVKKGRSIWFSGRLQVDDEGWDGLRGGEVEIYFRANGSSGWKYVTSTETRWGGKFSAKTRAWKSGTFKAVYDGDDETNGSESRTDWVRVYSWHH